MKRLTPEAKQSWSHLWRWLPSPPLCTSCNRRVRPDAEARDCHLHLPKHYKQNSSRGASKVQLFANGQRCDDISEYGGDQRIPSVRLALSPAVAAKLQSAAVAQDGLAGERGLAQQVANDHGSELGLNQIENAAALGARGVWEVTGVQRTQIIRPQEAGARLGLGPGVASDAERGLVAEDGVAHQRGFKK